MGQCNLSLLQGLPEIASDFRPEIGTRNCTNRTTLPHSDVAPKFNGRHFWGVAQGSSISWVAKFKGDNKFRMQAVKWVVAKLQGEKTAPSAGK